MISRQQRHWKDCSCSYMKVVNWSFPINGYYTILKAANWISVQKHLHEIWLGYGVGGETTVIRKIKIMEAEEFDDWAEAVKSVW